TVVGTPLFIRLLHRRGYGQIIRDDGPTSHATKRGTPTMGGVVIVLNFVVVYFITHWIMTLLELENSGITVSGLLLLFLTAGMGLIGFLDDYIKISNQRSLGLTPTGKIVGQGAVGVAFAVLALNFPRYLVGLRFCQCDYRRDTFCSVVQSNYNGHHQRREPHRWARLISYRSCGYGVSRIYADNPISEQPGLLWADGSRRLLSSP